MDKITECKKKKKKKKFWRKICKRKELNRNVKWINNIKKLEKLKILKKKISNWKTPGHDGMHGFSYRDFTSTHDRLTQQVSSLPTRSKHFRMGVEKGKLPWSRGTPKMDHPQQLSTDKFYTYDLKNPNHTETTMRYFQKNKNETTGKQEKPITNNILTSISSKKPKRGGKKRFMDWLQKALNIFLQM